MYINNQINSIISSSVITHSIEGFIIKCVLHYYYYFFFLAVLCGILVPQPGIEVVPPAVEAQTLIHRTTREVPVPHYSTSRKLIGVIDQMPTKQIPRPGSSQGNIFHIASHIVFPYSIIYTRSFEKGGTTNSVGPSQTGDDKE